MKQEEENYEALMDEAEDQYEDSQELSEGQIDQYESGPYSVGKEKSDLYNWFWKIVQLGSPKFKDDDLGEEALRLSKVGNLSADEIGKHSISVRDALVLANLGQTFHHATFGNFWRSVAAINVSTSMSKKGWLVEQSISQKKVRQRTRSASSPTEKSGIFGRKKTEESKEAQQP